MGTPGRFYPGLVPSRSSSFYHGLACSANPVLISPMGPGLCENTLPIIAQGKESRKGKGSSNVEESRYFLNPIFVAIGSKLVQ